MNQELINAFALTFFAGLATGIGGIPVLFSRKMNTRFLAGSLGFSAGVMLYVSFVELYATGTSLLESSLGSGTGTRISTLAFFAGIMLAGLIDKLVPEEQNPHEIRFSSETGSPGSQNTFHPLYRVGLTTAFAIAVHNLPEGLATFAAATSDTGLGMVVASAVAIHNIPEGLAVAIPIYFATGNRIKAFWYALLSGMAEPVGAVIGYMILAPLLGATLHGSLFSLVAGIMVFISLDELLPTAEEYGEHHLCIYGMVAGMLTMAASLLIL
ncbi:MAG: zinc transporter ZupT [Candidatus Wallbacteria bacterium]|nr:zinc transporter ZupT [Candidatus Wallbacteria bacterium]